MERSLIPKPVHAGFPAPNLERYDEAQARFSWAAPR